MIKGYIAKVTEYEAGWGSRPDGYLLCLNKETGERFATQANGKVWCMEDGSEYSIASEFKLCILTQEGKDLIDKCDKGVYWASDIDSRVEEM